MSTHLREAWRKLGTLEQAKEIAQAYCDAAGGARAGMCWAAAWNIREALGWPIVEGERDGIPHAWNLMPNGEIFDPTEAQFEKTALPTWRGFQADEEPFWRQYDAVIATQMRGRQRYYEVWTYGQTFGSFPRLDAAKAALEVIYGPLDWEHKRMEKVPVVHYYYGPTTEFTDPLNIYFVSKLPKLGTYKNLSNKRVANSPLTWDHSGKTLYRGDDIAGAARVREHGFALTPDEFVYAQDYGAGIYLTPYEERARSYGRYILECRLKPQARICNIGYLWSEGIIDHSYGQLKSWEIKALVESLGYHGAYDDDEVLVVYDPSLVELVRLQ